MLKYLQLVALLLAASTEVTIADERAFKPLEMLSKEDADQPPYRIFKYSPFNRPCRNARSYPLKNNSFLLVPQCRAHPEYYNEPYFETRVIYYHGDRDTWELGPEKSGIDVIYQGARISSHEFNIYMRKEPKMKGLTGSIYRVLRKPSWIQGDWEPAADYVCILDTDTNTYTSCKEGVPEPTPTKSVASTTTAPSPAPSAAIADSLSCDSNARYYDIESLTIDFEELNLEVGMDARVFKKRLEGKGFKFPDEFDCKTSDRVCTVWVTKDDCTAFTLFFSYDKKSPSGLIVEAVK